MSKSAVAEESVATFPRQPWLNARKTLNVQMGSNRAGFASSICHQVSSFLTICSVHLLRTYYIAGVFTTFSELRYKIYKLVIPRPVLSSREKSAYFHYYHASHIILTPPLALVSPQVRSEVLPLWFDCDRLYLRGDGIECLASLRHCRAATGIRVVGMHMRECRADIGVRVMFKTGKDLIEDFISVRLEAVSRKNRKDGAVLRVEVPRYVGMIVPFDTVLVDQMEALNGSEEIGFAELEQLMQKITERCEREDDWRSEGVDLAQVDATVSIYEAGSAGYEKRVGPRKGYSWS